MSGNALIVATAKEGDGTVAFCDGCGEEKTRNELLSCKGCESARYCRKVRRLIRLHEYVSLVS